MCKLARQAHKQTAGLMNSRVQHNIVLCIAKSSLSLKYRQPTSSSKQSNSERPSKQQQACGLTMWPGPKWSHVAAPQPSPATARMRKTGADKEKKAQEGNGSFSPCCSWQCLMAQEGSGSFSPCKYGRSRRDLRLRILGPEEKQSPSWFLELLGEEDDRCGVATAADKTKEGGLGPKVCCMLGVQESNQNDGRS